MNEMIVSRENAMSVSDMERLAIAIAKSQLFGMKTPEQALALMAICQAEGLHPAIAARDYHIIQGRPTLKADAMLARFQVMGGVVRWAEYTDARVTGIFSHPSSPNPVTVSWGIEEATRAKLTGKEIWKQYPRAMLRSRVISEGVRTVFPGVAVGFYTPEEASSALEETAPIKTADRIFDEPKPSYRLTEPTPIGQESAAYKAICYAIAESGLDFERVERYVSNWYAKQGTTIIHLYDLSEAQAHAVITTTIPALKRKQEQQSRVIVSDTHEPTAQTLSSELKALIGLSSEELQQRLRNPPNHLEGGQMETYLETIDGMLSRRAEKESVPVENMSEEVI